MADPARTPWRVAVCGSASVGKTSLVRTLAEALGLPCIEEEMRDFLERSGVRLSQLPPHEIATILLQLWRERASKERSTLAFVADNCSLDFIAYALHYRCFTNEMASVLLPEVIKFTASYDAIFVLPWGALPYVADGIRTPSEHEQLGYQLILEGLLRRHVVPSKLHHLPEGVNDLASRTRWACSVLDEHKGIPGSKRDRGTVYLVGAGPGDPRLLTLRAVELLRQADVVAHDLLVSPSVLSLVPSRAELLPVGRRYGAEKTHYRLHPEVLARARNGQTVVRLKCGDPLVFGRGGEEAEELAEAGIPFEIVPGISAALGAAAYSGIPLTHRIYSSTLTLSTGHESSDGQTVNTSVLERSGQGTAVLYMVTRRLRTNLDRLIRDGYDPQTPAAYIAGATTSNQRVIVGTLGNLPELTCNIDVDIPALVIAGSVVDLRAKIAWFEKKQLNGFRILLARARPGPSAIAAHLRDFGAEVVEAPNISIGPLDGDSSLLDALRRLNEFDVLVFCCALGVQYAWRTIKAHHYSRLIQVVAVGDQAHEALVQAGEHDVISCAGSCDNALQTVASSIAGQRVVLITSSEGRPALAKQLASIAATVEAVAAYRVIHSFVPFYSCGAFDCVVSPSSSAARLILSNQSCTVKHLPFITMGPHSAAAAREYGASHVIHSPQDNIESLVSCVVQELADKQRAFSAAAVSEKYNYTRFAH